MNEDRSSSEPDDKTWVEKIADVFSGEPKTRQDLIDILTIAKDSEVIDADAHGIIEGAMKVSDMQVRDIMIPRSHMTVIKEESSLQEVLPQIIESAHSRYPVIGESPDDILGILLVKDLLPQILHKDQENFDIHKLLRTTNVVPESKRLNVLLREFRENRNHMAIVIDEYGGVAGLITIEDVLEQIVGEIEDETDAETDSPIRRLTGNEYLIKALTPIDDFNEAFEVEFSDDEFDTIGGLVTQKFGYMPQRDEVTNIGGFEFKVLNCDRRKIHMLYMRPSPQQQDQTEQE
ncbi:CBS domain-containing protein [Halieaceae bacterium]|nr:CBS domain-containing protein [Halieaceae bacterium]